MPAREIKEWAMALITLSPLITGCSATGTALEPDDLGRAIRRHVQGKEVVIKSGRLTNAAATALSSPAPHHGFFGRDGAPSLVGLRAPVELDRHPLCEWISRFPKLSPFLRFRQPVVHFFPGKRSALTAHIFQRAKLISWIHDAPKPPHSPI